MSRPSFAELDGEDPYTILGLRPGAGEDDIRSARKRLLRRHHPDLPGGDLLRTQRITAAADLLLDPLRRSAYDDAPFPRAGGGNVGFLAPSRAGWYGARRPHADRDKRARGSRRSPGRDTTSDRPAEAYFSRTPDGDGDGARVVTQPDNPTTADTDQRFSWGADAHYASALRTDAPGNLSRMTECGSSIPGDDWPAAGAPDSPADMVPGPPARLGRAARRRVAKRAAAAAKAARRAAVRRAATERGAGMVSAAASSMADFSRRQKQMAGPRLLELGARVQQRWQATMRRWRYRPSRANSDGGFDSAPPWSGLAVVAAVSSVVCTPVSPVLGVMALAQIKHTGQRGRGLAIGSIVAGVLFGIAWGFYLVWAPLR